MVDTPGTPVSPVSLPIGGTLAATFRVVARAPVTIALLALVGGLPDLYEAAFAGTGQQTTSRMLIQIVVSQAILNLTQVAITLVAARAFGAPPRGAPILAATLRRYIPALATTLISIAVIAVGMLLLVVPGAIWACMFIAALPVCVLESRGPFSSFGRSAALTAGMRWPIFVINLVIFAPAVLTASLTYALGGSGPQQWLGVATGIVWPALSTVLSTVVYLEIRRIKEAAAPGVAEVFD